MLGLALVSCCVLVSCLLGSWLLPQDGKVRVDPDEDVPCTVIESLSSQAGNPEAEDERRTP